MDTQTAKTEERKAELKYEDFAILRQIGREPRSIILLAENNESKQKFCLKLVPESYLTSALKEYDIQKSLSSHPHIVKAFGIFRGPKPEEWSGFSGYTCVYIVLEYMKEGELFDFINKYKKKLTEDNILHIYYQLESALKFIHSKNIMHLDIKLENILVDSVDSDNNATVKIADFGASLEASEAYDRHIGTLGYHAPEIGNKSYDNKVDLWSLGVTLFACSCIEYPVNLPGKKTDIDYERNARRAIRKAPIKWDKLKHPKVEKICRVLLDRDPTKRTLDGLRQVQE